MDTKMLLLLACVMVAVSARAHHYRPHHVHHRRPMAFYPRQRFTRFAPHPPPRKIVPIPVSEPEEPKWTRPKRDHDDYHDGHRTSGVTGPVHTFVKTDKNANYKWGVRHHVGNKYAS